MTVVKSKGGCGAGKRSHTRTGKWNNHDLKVMIQWFKRDGDKAMPKNKEDLLLCYRETHTRILHDDRGTYLHEDVAAAIADTSHFAFSSTSQQNTKAFAVAAAGSQDDAYVPPPTHVAPSVANTTTSIVTAAGAIVVDSAPTVPTSGCQQNAAPSNALL
jgi:hypothetical protein